MIIFYSWFFSYLFAVIFSILLFRFKSNFYHKAAIKLTAKDKDYDKLINKSQIYKKRSFISIFVWSLIFSIIYLILVLTIHEVRQEFFVYLRTSGDGSYVRTTDQLIFSIVIGINIILNIFGIMIGSFRDGWLRNFMYNLSSKFNTIKIKRSFDDFVTDKIIAKEKQINKRQTNSIN